MSPVLFGKEHILYIIISAVVCGGFSYFALKKAKNDGRKRLLLTLLAALLFVAILANRLSQVFRYDTVRWYAIIPDSYCGMTSLVLALSVIFGRKNNAALHFLWHLGLFGGISTVIYATFVGQGPTIFYLPTISGLLHHSLSATLSLLVLLFGWVDVSYKKWYYTFFGFTAYITVGAFLMSEFGVSDAFHIVEPLISDTPLTAWFMGPLYAVSYGAILLGFECFRLYKRKKQ